MIVNNIKDEQKEPIVIRANRINRLNAKIVNITVKHVNSDNPFTTIDLPIEPALYIALLKLMTASKNFALMLPFTFYINKKGAAFDVKPSDHYLQIEAKKE